MFSVRSKSFFQDFFVFAAFAWLFVATPNPMTAQCHAKDRLYSRLLHSTAGIATPDGSGTAWVVDVDLGLLVTNYHVVSNDSMGKVYNQVEVRLPCYRNGRVIAERSYYDDNAKALEATGRVLRGVVLDADESVDLALIQIDTFPSDVTAVKLAASSSMPGDHLHSIGNPGASDSLWLYTEGAVKQVSKRSWSVQLGNRVMRLHAMAVETQAPTNPGDSGGPVVNDDGELVAVTHGGSQAASLLNLAIDVTEVQNYLIENKWLGRARTPAQHVDRAAHFYCRPLFRNVEPRHDRPDLALIDLDHAIKLDNRSADYYIRRAEVLERIAVSSSAEILIAIGMHQPAPAAVKETLDRAMQDIDAALKLNPKSAPAYARRSSVIHTRRICRIEGADNEKVSAALLQALRLDPSCWLAIELVATIVGADDPALAIKCLDRFVASQPQNAHAMAYRAELHRRMKNPTQSLKDYESAIQLKSDEPEFWIASANLLQGMGKSAEAVKVRLHVALTLRPENTENWCSIARLFAKMDKYDEALAAFGNALGWTAKLELTSPAPQTILVERAKVYIAKGDPTHAREDLGLALKIENAKQSPDKSFIGKAMNVLEAMDSATNKVVVAGHSP